MLQKKRMIPTISLNVLRMSSNCDVTISQNHFAVAALFLVEKISSDTFWTDLIQKCNQKNVDKNLRLKFMYLK